VVAAPPIVMRPTPFPNGTRSRIPASSMLLQEWVTAKYPLAQVFYELRLGPTQKHLVGVQVSPVLEAMLRVANWYADAVVITGTEALVIEAKVDPDPGAVGQVLFYRSLIYSTPALAAYTTMPVMPVVLFAEDDSGVTPFARGLGCRVEIYTPPWIATYLETRQFRNRSTPSPGTITTG
jgi:hypothetical protein